MDETNGSRTYRVEQGRPRRRRRQGHTIFVAMAALLLLASVVVGAGSPDLAEGQGGIRREVAGIADGRSGVHLQYLGTSDFPPDTVGDVILLTVVPAAGSQANPRFGNGTRTFQSTLQGAACDGDSDRNLLAPTKCYLPASPVYSDAPGDVDFFAENVTAGISYSHPLWKVTFYEPRLIIPAVSIAGDDFTAGFVQNTGSSVGTIVAAFVGRNGEEYPWTGDAAEVPPGGSANLQRLIVNDVLCGCLPSDFRGAIVVASDQPVAAVSHATEGWGTGRLRSNIQRAFGYDFDTTEQTITLPYISNQLEATYNTEFTVVNTGATVACVVVTYSFVPGAGAVGPSGRTPHIDAGPGGSGCASGYPLGLGAQLTFGPESGDGVLAMPAATRNTLMAAEVHVTGGSAGVTIRAYTTDAASKAAGYEGFLVEASGGTSAPESDLGTSIELPIALKTVDGYYTQVLLSNTSAEPANVDVTYEDEDGTYTANLTIPPGGVRNHSVYSDNVVPLGFGGAARVTSSVPIAAVLFRAKKISPASEVDEDIYTAVNGIRSDRAALVNYLPLISRRAGSGGGYDGENTWVSVSVPGGGSATVTLLSVGHTCGAEGVPVTHSVTTLIDGSFVFYQNADFDNGLGSNPPCFFGATTITSDVPVLVVADWISDLEAGDTEGVYNAFTP